MKQRQKLAYEGKEREKLNNKSKPELKSVIDKPSWLYHIYIYISSLENYYFCLESWMTTW